jgi:UDP-glucose 6-dehydrogenase
MNSEQKSKTIGIIGQGFIGKVMKRWHEDALVYDIAEGDWSPLREVLAQDIVYICVNFQDNCASQESRDKLNDYFAATKPGAIIIIKSTFIPGTTDYFQDLHKDRKFIYNPEFLTELSAWEDFTKPVFQILGVPYQSLDIIHEVFALLPDAPIKRVISPKDAEMLKHSFNYFYAMKVGMFNDIYDTCEKLGTDYETIREILVQDPRIGDSHSLTWHKGYRGFGGKCLPKEVEALRKLVGSPLLETLSKYNEELRTLRQTDTR